MALTRDGEGKEIKISYGELAERFSGQDGGDEDIGGEEPMAVQTGKAIESRHMLESKITEDLALAVRGWGKRCSLLAQKRELKQQGKTETDPAVVNVGIDIKCAQTLIFNAFCDEREVCDLEAFSLWLERLLEEDEDIERAFRYAVELAQRLKVLVPATEEDEAMVRAWQEGDQSVPRPHFIMKYNPRLQETETLMLADSHNQQMRNIHFHLEGLRRRANGIRSARKAEAEARTAANEETEE